MSGTDGKTPLRATARLFGAVALVVASACGARAQTAPASAVPPARVEPDTATAAEYEVYSALLNSAWRDTSYVVVEETTRHQPMGSVESRVNSIRSLGVADSVIPHFLRLNARPVLLRNRFSPRERVRILTGTEVAGLFPDRHPDPARIEAGWQTLRERFPGATGLVTFSRIAFADSGNTAIVSYWRTCMGRCAIGEMVRMERVGGVWTVKARTSRSSS